MADVFEPFTERTRRVLELAQDEARRLNHNYIGTEHLLLGLVREGDGVAARVLSNMGVQLPEVRSAVESIVGRGQSTIAGEIELTPRSRHMIQYAIDEARRLNHRYIGTEHLLLGIIREGEGVAAGVIESLGVNREKVRAQVMRIVASSSTVQYQSFSSAPATPGAEPERFPPTEEGIAALQCALEEAVRTHQSELAIELRDQERDLREQLNAEPDAAASRVRSRFKPASPAGAGPVEALRPEPRNKDAKGERGIETFTEPARHAFTMAMAEARGLRHNYLGTEHLLLGLTRVTEGNAHLVLRSFDVGVKKVRSTTEFIVGRGQIEMAGEIALTPRTKDLLRLSVGEARRLKADAIGTEHLLLGLIAEGEGIAAGVLESLGVSLQRLRDRVSKGIELGAIEGAGADPASSDNGTRGGPDSA